MNWIKILSLENADESKSRKNVMDETGLFNSKFSSDRIDFQTDKKDLTSRSTRELDSGGVGTLEN